MKVLLLCANSNRAGTGEPQSAHQWIEGLSRIHDVTLHVMSSQVGAECPSRQLPETRVVLWPDWFGHALAPRLNYALKPGYPRFYLRVRRWIRRALGRGERFDLAHQLSPLALRYPSPAVGFGIPLVVGPIAGSLETPPSFRGEFTTVPWYTRLRALDHWRLRYDPLLRTTYSSAAAVIGVAPYVLDLLRGIPIRRFLTMSETGVEALPELPARVRSRQGEPLRLLFVGRIIRNKGVRDAIRALALLKDPGRVHLDIVGTGDDRPACEREATEGGVADRVRLHGHVARSEVDRFYRQADVFVFPSFREPSGNVVLEALSYGLPLIAADRGGPGHVVNARCGIAVTPTDPRDYAAQIARAIETLDDDRDLLESLAVGARNRIREVALWEEKIRWMDALYREIVADAAGPHRPTPP